jgi:MFS family permease
MVFMRFKSIPFTRHTKVLTRKTTCDNIYIIRKNFMLKVDTTNVNVAFPSLQRAFNLSIENLQWIMSTYILEFGGFLLLGGKTADLYGRGRVFLTGVVGFTCSSLLIGITSSAFLIIPCGQSSADLTNDLLNFYFPKASSFHLQFVACPHH